MSSPTRLRHRPAAVLRPGTPADAPPGAALLPDGACSFRVWAPAVREVRVRLHSSPERVIPLAPDDRGYHVAVADGVHDGDLYTLLFDGDRALPDPASRAQPLGVHGPSRVVGSTFDWRHHTWPRPDLRTMVLYELHVGTFTAAGTFDAIVPRLSDLRELGITAIELMPIAQYPGDRNWGYDGVFPFAAQWSYGGATALKRLVDAAHGLGMHVILDVVYNHLGPEGNYLPACGPYFTNTYHTPWGDALNFDGADSDEVRHFFLNSALQWIDEFRMDGLRLDAIHAIIDRTAQPFLRELADSLHGRARDLDRDVVFIAESDLADPRVIQPSAGGGLGIDAQWLDDFHHAVRTLLTGESDGYYADYGTLEHLARAFRRGYVYAGEYSVFRRRRHGAPADRAEPSQFVAYVQNHDQTGNRMEGTRLSAETGFEQLKLAAAATLLAPFTPLLFMGEEYGEERPFPYFVSHGDADLVEAVRTGRREEFASFTWQGEPPDPQAHGTFRRAVLDWHARDREPHATLLRLHRRLLTLRRAGPALAGVWPSTVTALRPDGTPAPDDAVTGTLAVRRADAAGESLLLLNFAPVEARAAIPPDSGWQTALDTADDVWRGPGSALPASFVAGTEAIVTLQPHSAVLLLAGT